MTSLNNVISLQDWTANDYLDLYDRASSLREVFGRSWRPRFTDDFVLGSLFFQNSTRTRLSFEAATVRLGGHWIGFSDATTLRYSDFYQESLEDTIAVVSAYCDVIVLRHPDDTAAQIAVDHASVPVINAGCGNFEHPTQTLLDFYELTRLNVSLAGSTLGYLGDPGCRVFKSFVHACAAFGVANVHAVVPPGAPDGWQREAAPQITSVASTAELMATSDAVIAIPFDLSDFHEARVVDHSRSQTLPAHFVLNSELLTAHPHVPVLHCGPRGAELPPETDGIPSVHYLDGVADSVAVRAAVIEHALSATATGRPRILSPAV